ncbi:hypothetical protein QCA50_002602 [Cerrena zonata]|uniref:Uncharacterized protein n=1 Tax=Cerrena zonata TaxID=2478898 RepID=A0AAW0GK43_9APHY
MRQRLHDEADGTLCVFENSICRKSSVLDPERTQDMIEDEKLLLHDLQELRVHMSNEYFREHPNAAEDGWIPAYTNIVAHQLRVELTWGRRITDQCKEGKKPREDIHWMRRRVSIIHQEVFLL